MMSTDRQTLHVGAPMTARKVAQHTPDSQLTPREVVGWQGTTQDVTDTRRAVLLSRGRLAKLAT